VNKEAKRRREKRNGTNLVAIKPRKEKEEKRDDENKPDGNAFRSLS
jgi:hypothetical protein